MAENLVIRRATEADVLSLSEFQCSTGPWYEFEVEQSIQGEAATTLAAPGDLCVMVAEDETGIVGVTAHTPYPHPDGGDTTVTCIPIGGVRVDRQGDGGSVAEQLLAAVLDDARRTDREPIAFARVAEENARMRRILENRGFISSSVPSDPRYLFYVTRLA